jgi:coenzyme F420-0:L-glutamate ligase/coenzyme F420-1:gamma-L-glutamate ligase
MTEAAALSLWALPGVPMAREGDDVATLILDGLGRAGLSLNAGDVVVVAQKLVSKAEGRLIALSAVTASPRAIELAETMQKDPRLIELILSESVEVLRARLGLVIVEHRLGLVMANAGVDQSNIGHDGGEHALLLPRDPDASAARIREALGERAGVDVAVLIIDSIGRAWRQGTVGSALGVAGMPGLLDLRGRPDLFGRELQTSTLGLADEVAAAASLVMGQAGEGRPIVLARGVPYERRDGSAAELVRPRELDLFR